jgi:hypothetical protein
MKLRSRCFRVLPGVSLLFAAQAHAVGTEFSYQGLLEVAGTPASSYDFEAQLFDAPCSVAPCIGAEVAAAQTIPGVVPQAGRFTLLLDFGAVFTGAERYLELRVKRSGAATYTTLLPRQRLLATPYAQHADRASVASAVAAPLSIEAAGFPDTRFDFQSVGNVVFRGANDPGAPSTLPVEGAGTRLMWYPQKAALRAGRLFEEDDPGTDTDPSPVPPFQWNEGNIGNGSVALGTNVRAQGTHAVALGYWANAAGTSSFAAGEGTNATGAASVALGFHAHTNARQGSFVFGDRSTVDLIRAGVNHSATWRVNGGFRIFTSSNLSTGVTIQSGSSVSNWGQSGAVISTSTGAMLTTGGIWQNASDVARKHAFAPVDGEDILARLSALPIESWSYTAEDASIRHLGPTAQDFRAAFGLGGDPKSIGTVDADGVALVAAQALEARSTRQQEQIRALQDENAELRATLDALAARLSRLETGRAGQPR